MLTYTINVFSLYVHLNHSYRALSVVHVPRTAFYLLYAHTTKGYILEMYNLIQTVTNLLVRTINIIILSLCALDHSYCALSVIHLSHVQPFISYKHILQMSGFFNL